MPSKPKAPTYWRDKLKDDSHHKIVEVPPKMEKRWGKGKMVIPQPLAVDALIKKVPQGKLVTVTQLRERLAKDYKVDIVCPITTGIFIRIVAEAAEEDMCLGRGVACYAPTITPYWRVINPDGTLKENFPGGTMAQAKRLKAEGHKIEAGKGKKKTKVRDFEKVLVKR